MSITSKLNLVFKVLVIAFVVTWTAKEVVLPTAVGLYYYNEYQRLVVACNTAMDDSWYFGEEAGTTEVAHLVDCHDYDKTRKIMLMTGVPREYIQYLGLKALETYQRPAREFAEHHRFDRR